MKQTQPFPYTFLINKVVKTEDAKVSIMTKALQYGTAFFGGIRGYYNNKEGCVYIFRLPDHYERFLLSTKILGCGFSYTKEDLIKITLELARKNNPKTDVYFRPFAYDSKLGISPSLANTEFSFSLYMLPLGEYLPIDSGLNLMVSSWRRISDNAIPSRAKIAGTYVNSSLAKKEATENGYDDAIFLNEAGDVSEASAANLMIVRNGKLITPAKDNDILEGITRRTILQLSQDLGIPSEERTIDRTELYICDEAFLCGTGCQVAWIKSIDKRQIGNGKIGDLSKRIQELFFKVVRGEEKKYKSWCTKV